MKNKFLNLLLLIIISISSMPVIATTPAVPWFTPPTPSEDSSYDGSTREKLKTLKVNVQWNNVSVATALQDLTSQSKQVDPTHQGIQFTSKLPADDQKVNLILTDASLDDVLGYLSGQANLRVKIHKDEVILLAPKATNKPGQ